MSRITVAKTSSSSEYENPSSPPGASSSEYQGLNQVPGNVHFDEAHNYEELQNQHQDPPFGPGASSPEYQGLYHHADEANNYEDVTDSRISDYMNT